MEERESISQKRRMAKQRVIGIYRDLDMFLKSDGYRKDLEIELEKSNPGFIKDIQNRIMDMEKTDHGIVIAGETSAGKSTLINMILQKNIFIGHTAESTSTICKIRNLDRVRIIAKSKDGQIDETDLTEICDLTSERGVELLRTALTELTDKTLSEKSVDLEFVDVGFTIPFLKGNAILVDTPGIGGSGDVTPKLMEYLPNAVSFIFVINVESAGGMQSDRLPKILNSLTEMQIKNEMPCFDPEDVIFITNKWDSIRSQFDVEKEREQLWKNINMDLRKKWPHVKESHIFRMNFLDVHVSLDTADENASTKEFKKFREVLFANVEKAKDIRIKRHFGFLQELLKNVSKGLNARLQLGKRSAKEQQALEKTHLRSLDHLKRECEKMRKSVPKKINQAIEEIAKACYDYMSSDLGKDHILNPEFHTPIMDVPWTVGFFVEEIKSRINMYIETYLQSQDVVQRFNGIKKEIIDFYKEVSFDLSSMEADWTHVIKHEISSDKSMVDSLQALDDLPLTLKIPILVVTIVLTAVAAACIVVLSPVLIPALLFMNTEDRKRRVIDDVYRANMLSIRSQINHHLKASCGNALNLLFEKVSERLLPNRIHSLETMIQRLSHSREEILANIESISYLANKLEAMRMSAVDLQSAFLDEI